MNQIFNPIRKLFSNYQFTVLLAFVVGLALIINYFGKMITPLLASLVVAYLLEGVITRLTKYNVPRIMAVLIVFVVFSAFVTAVVFVVLPLLIQQSKDILINAPKYIELGQNLIIRLPDKYPELISMAQANQIISSISSEATAYAQKIISGGVIAPLVVLVTLAIYFILVPVMVFFLLKDKTQIINWFGCYLPFDNPLLNSVWSDVDVQIGNYIRGKFTEILIIWFLSWISFLLLGLNYALLLSFIVGISVLIPYIGATVVTFPVIIVAFVQWGVGENFYILLIVYFVIQILDGNVIVPLIFSEAVSVHPIAIIAAVLLFGGLWGFWGVFFAIPLATVIKAIMNAWTVSMKEQEQDSNA